MALIKRFLNIFTSPRAIKSQDNHAESYVDVYLAPKSSLSYFGEMENLQNAFSSGDFAVAARHVHNSLKLIPEWVEGEKESYGSFDIQSIPAIEKGGIVLALTGDDDGLEQMQNTIFAITELAPWKEVIEQHLYDRKLFTAILDAIKTHPGILQTDVKKHVGESDGRRVSNLIYYLEKAGKIVRKKESSTYRLYVFDSNNTANKAKNTKIPSHRTDKKSPRIQKIQIASLNYIPLPKSPAKWEESKRSKLQDRAIPSKILFEVRDADWKVQSVEKIPMNQRPDPAYRKSYIVRDGLFSIDDLGNAESIENGKSSAIKYGRNGDVAAQCEFKHGIYRIGANPVGNGLILMSEDCIIHAYNSQFQSVFETSLADYPEIKAMQKNAPFLEDIKHLKNHIRCVSLSRDNKRYLFTVVDEAWCLDTEGKCLWGVKLPPPRKQQSSIKYDLVIGTSEEINDALAFMDLALPVTPHEISNRYRELAKKWHPDLNRGNPDAESRMQSLNSAKEVLFGMQENSASDTPDTGIEVTVEINMGHEEDWIYAASFAADSDRVYLASYSGLVVALTSEGTATLVYDIGGVPRRIIDTGDYLYLLTDTRLYILKDEKLHALVDTYDSGDLIVAHKGFGLLESKKLQWYQEDGTYMGSVVSKHPIRRVYTKNENVIIETRQNRAVIEGMPDWWQ